jgi:hypothetical protein
MIDFYYNKDRIIIFIHHKDSTLTRSPYHTWKLCCCSLNILARLGNSQNDMVQPCDTTQVRSDSDFGVKSATVQVYENNYNSQSERWIGLHFYVDSPDMFSYYGLKFQVNRTSRRHHNTGQHRLYEFCYLLPFDLWTSYLVMIFFSYKDVAAGFGNFLVPLGSLMSCSIISKCGKDSLMFHNPFLIRIPYSS